MNIDCNECRQRLGDALDETANTSAQKALTQHLADCDACRAELRLMQAARAELRDFPVLTAPDDLRSRVRAQLEAKPIAATPAVAALAETRIITAPADIKSTPDLSPHKRPSHKKPLHQSRRKPEPTTQKSWRDYLRAFLNHSTTITWASCCVLILVYVVSLSQKPQTSSPYAIAERAPVDESLQQQNKSKGAEKKAVQSPPAATGPSTNAPVAKVSPRSTAPGNPLPTSPAPPSDVPIAPNPIPSSEIPTTKPIPSNPQCPPATQNKKSETLPPAAAPQQKKPDRLFANNGNTNSQTRARKEDAKPAPSPAPSPPKQRRSYMAPSTPSSPPQAARAPAAITSADHAAEDSEASELISRDVTTRIVPPRNLGWSQVSVVLSGGAHFDDGQKSRVIWSGSAQAGEAIELNFSVQSAGGGTAKITLQEVKKGQAQTVAYKTVGVGASR